MKLTTWLAALAFAAAVAPQLAQASCPDEKKQPPPSACPGDDKTPAPPSLTCPGDDKKPQ